MDNSLLNKMLSFPDYKYLKALAKQSLATSEALINTYDSIDFNNAPEDTLLVVVSNKIDSLQIGSTSLHDVIAGTTFVKLSDKTVEACKLQQEEGTGLVYFDNVHFKSHPEGTRFETAIKKLGGYDNFQVEGKVVPINSESMSKLLFSVPVQILEGTFDLNHFVTNATNYKLVEDGEQE